MIPKCSSKLFIESSTVLPISDTVFFTWKWMREKYRTNGPFREYATRIWINDKTKKNYHQIHTHTHTHTYIYKISVYKFWKSNHYRSQSKFSLQEYSCVLFFSKGTTKMSPNMEILSNLGCPYSKIQ